MDSENNKTPEYLKSRTFLIGFGFFGISLVWALYSAYLPVILKERYGLSSSAVGGVTSFNHFINILLIAGFGTWSDRVGKRRPFILVGALLASFAFALLPAAVDWGDLVPLLLVMVLFNVLMSSFRSPTVALMPDFTPSSKRSQANGIINFMGGIGALCAFFGGKPLYDRHFSLPFIVGALLLLGVCVLLVLRLKEEARPAGQAILLKSVFKDVLQDLRQNLKTTVTGAQGLLPLFSAIFLWFLGFTAISVFFTTYAKFQLGISESSGAQVIGFFSLTFILFAIPAGHFGARYGRKRTMMLGLILLSAAVFAALGFTTLSALIPLFCLAGLGWALVNVNSLPMVLDSVPRERVGSYTGLYYFFSQLSAMVSPLVAGTLMDFLGNSFLLIFSALSFLAAAVVIARVRE